MKISSLSNHLIDLLIKLGNWSDDWNKIKLEYNNDTKYDEEKFFNDLMNKRYIENCNFYGKLIINIDLIINHCYSRVSFNDNEKIRMGLFQSNFFDSVSIQLPCHISYTQIIRKSYIDFNSIIMNCGEISGSNKSNNSNCNEGERLKRREICVGSELGYHAINVHMDDDYVNICRTLFTRNSNNNDNSDNSNHNINGDNISMSVFDTKSSSSCDDNNYTHIFPGVQLLRCDKVICCLIGLYTKVEDTVLNSSCIGVTDLNQEIYDTRTLSVAQHAMTFVHSTLSSVSSLSNSDVDDNSGSNYLNSRRSHCVIDINNIIEENNNEIRKNDGHCNHSNNVLDYQFKANEDIIPTAIKGGVISNTLIQPGVEICGSPTISNSFLMESSKITHHPIIDESILGPDSSVGGGECISSLIGPHIGFHHQALLISSVWPYGRGNLAYGTMVGANHTGRQPSQEAYIGEGILFGLGVGIKFPIQMMKSQYSMVTSGVVLLPQRISMPLSLITMPTTTLNSNRHSNSSGDSISPMLPLIKPGWVYVGNTYMLARNNYKYKKSSKSKFYKTSFDILRRHVVVDIYHAKKLLEKLLNESQNDSMIKSGHSGTVCYTEKECKALGKCVLLHDDLIAGISQYTTLVHRWSIKVMMENNSRVLVGGDATSSSSNSSSSGNIISSNSNSNDDLINLDSIDDYNFEEFLTSLTSSTTTTTTTTTTTQVDDLSVAHMIFKSDVYQTIINKDITPSNKASLLSANCTDGFMKISQLFYDMKLDLDSLSIAASSLYYMVLLEGEWLSNVYSTRARDDIRRRKVIDVGNDGNVGHDDAFERVCDDAVFLKALDDSLAIMNNIKAMNLIDTCFLEACIEIMKLMGR